MDSITNLNKMKVADLKKELKNRNLAITGNKTELVERLHEALNESNAASLNESSMGDEDINEDEILAGGTDDSKLSEQEEAAVLNGNAKVSPTKSAVAAAKVNGVSGDSKPEEESKENNVLKARSERFGVVSSETTKKATRAERFGIPLSESKSKKFGKEPVDMEQLKKRADRFGEITSKQLTNADVDEKKKERANRFGIVTDEKKSAAVEDAKVARAARFAAEEAGAKKTAAVEEEVVAEEVTAIAETGTPKAAKKPRIVF